MIWHDGRPPSRGTRWFILVLLLFAVAMLCGATRLQPVGASAPTATAWIECDYDGCQIDIVAPGYEIQEYFVRYVVYEDHRL